MKAKAATREKRGILETTKRVCYGVVMTTFLIRVESE